MQTATGRPNPLPITEPVRIPCPDHYALELCRQPDGTTQVRATLCYIDPGAAEALARCLADYVLARLGEAGTDGEAFG